MANRGKVASECEAPLYKQLEESFIAEIVAGRLKPGDVVPSTYTLAEQFGISRVTAVRCYEELKGRGFLTARRGGSTVVNPHLALGVEKVRVNSPEPADSNRFDNRLGEFLQKPPAQLLPTKAWMKAMQSVIESGAQEYSGPAEREVAPRLRRAIASFLMRMRGISAYPHNLLIFDSKWQALAFVAENFLEAGETFVVENPGDPLVFQELSRRSGNVRLLPVDREGAAVEHLEPRSGVKLIVVSPSAQFATGVVMSERRRQHLSRYAGQSEALLLEDDCAALLRFGKQPEPSLYNKFKDALHLGSFSTYLGGLCQLSYLVVPDHLLQNMRSDLESRTFSQTTFVHLTLAQLIESGALELAIFRQRATLQKRRQQILSQLLDEFKDLLTVNAGSTGFELLLRFNSRLPREQLLQAINECGIETCSLDRCYAHKDDAQRLEMLLPLFTRHDPSGNSIERLFALKGRLSMRDVWSAPSIAAPADGQYKHFAGCETAALTECQFAANADVQSLRLMYTGPQ